MPIKCLYICWLNKKRDMLFYSERERERERGRVNEINAEEREREREINLNYKPLLSVASGKYSKGKCRTFFNNKSRIQYINNHPYVYMHLIALFIIIFLYFSKLIQLVAY